MQTSAEFPDHYSPSSSSSLTIITTPPPSYTSSHLPSKLKSIYKYGNEAGGDNLQKTHVGDRGLYRYSNNSSSLNSPESLTGLDKDQEVSVLLLFVVVVSIFVLSQQSSRPPSPLSRLVIIIALAPPVIFVSPRITGGFTSVSAQSARRQGDKRPA
ncbi:hypothetical protein EDD21DRAFT_392214 [Dissophora ornata]|nr:hypothetical protein EDD21DRAFT_392214 [Dissophora ornata]